jgi:hypothetical protein
VSRKSPKAKRNREACRASVPEMKRPEIVPAEKDRQQNRRRDQLAGPRTTLIRRR